ncbi:hypothetical protein L484_000797 [Morus notabilis]|uniref:Uncharacterized protein n=1 Tax=Morus notabilis TaxID=981085 RepID=W9R5L2_9ROSA|nr:hypothetical protein L484_000797 [Morus notabilis]
MGGSLNSSIERREDKIDSTDRKTTTKVGVDVPWEEWIIERGIFLSQAFTNSVRTHGRLKIATAFAGLALQVEVLTGRVAEGGRRVVAGWRLGDVRATVVADGD